MKFDEHFGGFLFCLVLLVMLFLVVPVQGSHGISPAAISGSGSSAADPYVISNGVTYTLYFYKEITWSIYGDTLPSHCDIDGTYGASGRWSNPGTITFRLHSVEPNFAEAHVHEQNGWEYIYVTNTIPPTITFQSDGSFSNCNWTHLQVNYNNMGSYVKENIDIHVSKGTKDDYWVVHGSTYATTSETVMYFEEYGNFTINYAVTYNGIVYSGSSTIPITNCAGSNWTGSNETLPKPTFDYSIWGPPATGGSQPGNQPWEPGRIPTYQGDTPQYGVNPGSPWSGSPANPGSMWSDIGSGGGSNWSFPAVGFNTSYTLIDNFLNQYITNAELPNIPPNLSYVEDTFINGSEMQGYFNESLIPSSVTGPYFDLVDNVFAVLKSIVSSLFSAIYVLIDPLVGLIVGGLGFFSDAVEGLLFFIEPMVMIMRIIVYIIPPPFLGIALLALAIDFVRLILNS